MSITNTVKQTILRWLFASHGIVKTCTNCKKTLPLDAFYRSTKRGKYGRRAECKFCRKPRNYKNEALKQKAKEM